MKLPIPGWVSADVWTEDDDHDPNVEFTSSEMTEEAALAEVGVFMGTVFRSTPLTLETAYAFLSTLPQETISTLLTAIEYMPKERWDIV